LINKIDLLPHIDFDLNVLLKNIGSINSKATKILMSARTGQGLDDWIAWLNARIR